MWGEAGSTFNFAPEVLKSLFSLFCLKNMIFCKLKPKVRKAQLFSLSYPHPALSLADEKREEIAGNMTGRRKIWRQSESF